MEFYANLNAHYFYVIKLAQLNLVAENKATAINTDTFTPDDNGMIFSSKTTLTIL